MTRTDEPRNASGISPTREKGLPTQNPATYVLVHGAWHGSWCWKRVRKGLRDTGHQVFTPTLTGLGERSHLNSAAVNLSTHIADVVNLLRWEDLSDVILCGHSYGGNVITGVADRIPERIRSLVYLDAFVPEDGECLFDLVPPELAQRMRLQAQTAGSGWNIPPLPAEHFNVNLRDAAWIKRPVHTPINRIIRRARQSESRAVSHARCGPYFSHRLGQLAFSNRSRTG